MMLFCPHPIGTRLTIGVDASSWVGHFAGIQNGVVFLRNAQLFGNAGKPIDGTRPLVRIPICKITFSAIEGNKNDEDDKGNKCDKDDKGGK